MSEKRATFKSFSSKEICQLSPLNMCENLKNVIYSCFTCRNQQSKDVSTLPDKKHNFHLKLFDTAVTFKCNQGYWKKYEWVQVNKYYHHAKFEIYQSYNVRENHTVYGFFVFFCHMQKIVRQAGPTLIITYSHFLCESKIERHYDSTAHKTSLRISPPLPKKKKN